MKKSALVTTLVALTIILAGCAVSAVALAQEEPVEPAQEEEDEGDIQDQGETQGEVLSIPTFTLLPTKEDTYVVTRDLYGLPCVTGVGDKNSCAVIRGAAVGNDHPWDVVKCRSGDSSVGTYASLLDNKRPVNVFAAPPALMTAANTYTINVRLGRVCRKK